MTDSETQPSVNSECENMHTGYNSTNLPCETASPTLKRPFSSRFSNPNANAVAYTVENTKTIDRTANAAFNFLGWDFELKLHQYKDMILASHITAGFYDFIYGDNSPYSSLGSIFYVVNEQTNFFSSIGNIPLKCTIEGSYAFLRGYPSIPSLFTPSSALAGALINFSLCMNKETKFGASQGLVDLTLQFIKSMLQAQNSIFHAMARMDNPYPTLKNIHQTGNFLGDFKELWQNNDPALASKILAHIKAFWILFDIYSYFDTPSENIPSNNHSNFDEKTSVIAAEDNPSNNYSNDDEKTSVGDTEIVNEA
jgi:hypothetical protein